jgi:ABC-2 type transport system permease protein
MNSLTSCFKTLLKNNFKRFGWLLGLEVLALFLGVILPLFYELENFSAYGYSLPLDVLASIRNPLHILLAFVFPTLVSVSFFQYLHEGKATSFIHSLPLSRNRLLASQSLSAGIFFAIPLLSVAVVVALVAVISSVDISGLAQVPALLFSFFIMEMLIFAFTTAVGMFTGHAAAQAIFSLILHFLPIGLTALIFNYFELYLWGLPPSSYFMSESWMMALPAMRLFTMTGGGLSALECLAYGFTALVFLGIAWLAYNRRDLEKAGDLITFAAIKPVFKYGFSFCVAISGYLYVHYVLDFSIIWVVVWALLGYCVAEVLLRKSFHILDSYKGFLGFLVVFALLQLSLVTGFFGYEQRIPDLEEVESVVISPPWVSINGLKDPAALEREEWFDRDYLYNSSMVYADMSEPENIALLQDLHRSSMDMSLQDEMWNPGYYLVYRLKDGSYLVRSYRIDEATRNRYMYQIVSTPEYRAEQALLNLKPADIDRTVVRNMFAADYYNYGEAMPVKAIPRQTEIAPASAAEFLAALQQDLREAPTSALLDSQKKYRIEFNHIVPREPDSYSAGDTVFPDNYDMYTYPINISVGFTRSLAYLEEKGYMQDLTLAPEQISQVRLEVISDIPRLATGDNLADTKPVLQPYTVQESRAVDMLAQSFTLDLTDPEAIRAVMTAEDDWLRADIDADAADTAIYIHYYTEEGRDLSVHNGREETAYNYSAHAETAPEAVRPYVEQLLALVP